MSTGFHARPPKRREEFNKDLKGIYKADIRFFESKDWRTGPDRYGITLAARLLKVDIKKLKKAIKELGLEIYWYQNRTVMFPRQLSKLKKYFDDLRRKKIN